MATTQEFYRLGRRLPRYTTKLSAFSNGMYLTQQVIPEGYSKVLVNYDIDDTGTSIKPRAGREVIQIIPRTATVLGPASLTDYVYAYNKDNTEVEELKDIVMSYGLYTRLTDIVTAGTIDYTRPIYVASMERRVDNSLYQYDEESGWVVLQEGTKETEMTNQFWCIDYDKEQESFRNVDNEDIGYVISRTVDNAYAFDKPFKDSVGRPIGTVYSNELYTFCGPKFIFKDYPLNEERNELLNFTKPSLCKLVITNTENGSTIKRKAITPQVLNPLEASSIGYNILLDNPYVFENESGGSLSGLGIIPYNPNNKSEIVFTPKLGQVVTLRAYYQYPVTDSNIQYKVESLDLTISNSEWELLVDYDKGSIKPGDLLDYDYLPKTDRSVVRITIREGEDTATEVPIIQTIVCGDSSYDKLQSKTFDLSTCKGMLNWQGCIGVYGVEGATDTIFFSDVENPSYFPFPNNTISFDNEILAVHNYLDYLLVITVDSIWLVTGNTTISTSTQKRILANIHIPEIDAVNTVILKDQIFFKTDTQFYVLKPNQYTSDATDLKNYVNSISIANLTQSFTASLVDIFNKVYVNTWQRLTREYKTQIRFEDFDVLDTVSIVRDSEVHYIYKVLPKLTKDITLDYINVHFVYNTLTRSWRLYFVAIGDEEVSYNPVLYRNKQSGVYYEFFPHTIGASSSSIVVAKQTKELVTDNITDDAWNLTEEYNNFQYIDTGNISLDDTFTKRFREVQFNLLNLEPETIKFYSDFKLDGLEQVQATKYELQHITDTSDPDYGVIFVTPVEHTNLDLQGTTVFSDSELGWTIDLSKFPDLSVATVRLTLQGRGRRGSLQLLNTSLKRYELADMHWVYRLMSAR